MRKNKFVAFFLCGLILISFSSCKKKESGDINISLIVKSSDSDFWQNVKNGADSAATEYNVEVKFSAPENEEDYSSQNELISRAVKSGADAIILSAIDYEENAKAVNRAAANGVKTVVIDSNVNSSQTYMFIGTDNIKAGIKAAEAATDGFAPESEIRIGIVKCYESTDNIKQREQGFKDFIKTVDNAEICAYENSLSNTESAEKAAEKIMSEYPEVNVLVGFNEWTTLGIGNAIKKQNMSQSVRGIGFDTNIISVGMLETGEMDALIVQNPFAIGYLGVKYAAEAVQGKESEKEIFTDTTVVTKENMFDSEIQKIIFKFN